MIGGFLDAYTYICRGGVFANAQTGNIVLLGINIANKNINGVMHYLVPILAFSVGVIVAEIVKAIHKRRDNIRLHWRQSVVAFEVLILIIVSLLPTRDEFNLIANTLVSFVCSLQVQTFRKLNGNSFATTMCTGNLRSATEHMCVAVREKSRAELKCSLQYFGVILFFIVGAIAGAALTMDLGGYGLLIACIGLMGVFGLMFIEHM